jgi:branched-chain amino acid transport system substrate-binding protein
VHRASDQIPIGVMFSTEGPYASLGREGFVGAMTAIAEINEGGVHPFELRAEIRDPKGNIEAYAGLCRDIVDSSGAQFVVGCTTSWSRKEVIPVLEKTGTHLWYPCPYEGFEGNDHVVYVGACPNQHIVPLLGYVLPRYGREPMLIGSNYIWGWETNRIAREHIERAGGTVKGERFVPLGDIDIAHIIEEVRQKRPDFVLNTLIGPSSEAFVEAYAGLGRVDATFAPERRPIISCNWTESEVAALGQKATGHLTVAPYFQSIETEGNRAFLATTKRLAPQQRYVSAFFAQSYAAVHMIARGIAATGRNEAAAVLQHAKTDSYEAPFGATRIHAETNHAILTPSIGRATAAGQFEVMMTAEAPVLPDPYLVRPLVKDAVTPTSRPTPTHLRVVK